MTNERSQKKRFAVGRRVLHMGRQAATVHSVAETPSVLGEYQHEILIDGHTETRRVLGCELELIPEAK